MYTIRTPTFLVRASPGLETLKPASMHSFSCILTPDIKNLVTHVSGSGCRVLLRASVTVEPQTMGLLISEASILALNNVRNRNTITNCPNFFTMRFRVNLGLGFAFGMQ